MKEEEKTEQKRNWRFRWLGMLFSFSHMEYLKGLWLEQKYPDEIGFYSEDMCKYFDDLSIENNYKSQLIEGLVTEEEIDVIKSFHAALDNYDEGEKTDSEILEDPNWQKIIYEGNQAWEKLKNVITNPEELNYMLDIEKHYLQKK